jgi:hypothetical protein
VHDNEQSQCKGGISKHPIDVEFINYRLGSIAQEDKEKSGEQEHQACNSGYGLKTFHASDFFFKING